MAIRTSVHDSTGFSPYFLNFGREMISNGTEYENILESNITTDYRPAVLQENQRKLQEIVQRNMKKAYDKYSHHYNLRCDSKRNFQEGEIVYKKNINQSDKSKNYVGKFAKLYTKVKIREIIGSNTYILENLDGNRIPGIFHSSFLKKI